MLNEISDIAFENFKRLLYKEVGIVLSDEKRIMVANRLSRRLRALSMSEYDEYYDYVNSKEGQCHDELQHVIDRLTTHKTHFFREQQHFNFLRSDVLKQYKNKPLRIWSAACSSGEEVYSLCILLSEALGDLQDWSIYGSDISRTELALCERGEYSEDQLEHVQETYLLKYFSKKNITQGEVTYKVSDNFSKHVRFGPFNLISDIARQEAFDIVLIRNVLIYFDVEHRRSVLNKMVKSLKPGGYLFTGRSETVISLIENAEVVQPSVFKKKQESYE